MTTRKKQQTYPKDNEESLRETVKKLKNQLRKLQKEKRDLINENQSLLEAWAKTESFLGEITDGVPLEDLLKFKKLPRKVTRKVEQKVEKQEAKEKWKKWRKENL